MFIDRIKIFIFLLIFGKKSRVCYYKGLGFSCWKVGLYWMYLLSYYIVFGYSVSVNNVNYMLFIGFWFI